MSISVCLSDCLLAVLPYSCVCYMVICLLYTVYIFHLFYQLVVNFVVPYTKQDKDKEKLLIASEKNLQDQVLLFN